MRSSKTPEKKVSPEARNEIRSRANSAPALVDNRPESVAQRSLQDVANNSARVAQLRAAQEMANSSVTGTASQSSQSVIQRQPMEKADGAAAAAAAGGGAAAAGGQAPPVHVIAPPHAVAAAAGGGAAAGAGAGRSLTAALPPEVIDHVVPFLPQPGPGAPGTLGHLGAANKGLDVIARNESNIIQLISPKIVRADEMIRRGREAYAALNGTESEYDRRQIAYDLQDGHDLLMQCVQWIRQHCSDHILPGSPLENILNELNTTARRAIQLLQQVIG